MEVRKYQCVRSRVCYDGGTFRDAVQAIRAMPMRETVKVERCPHGTQKEQLAAVMLLPLRLSILVLRIGVVS
jgi:hypothetical protein